jgi:membrane carboxypeptidase/penicillin-binding protein PbpC
MLVSIEDYKFYEHHGIDMEAFARAREINKRIGRPLYGGSTLTMQVARTLFLVPEKSYLRKYLEVLTAFELEAILSKERILELYFGYAEWGKGVFGVESAARRWYGRGVSGLSRDEAARLVALLSSPIKYRPDTIRKSRILSERYAFLSYRYDSPQPAAESAPGAAQAEATKPAESSQAAPAGEGSEPSSASQGAPPPLSPEPSSSDADEAAAEEASPPQASPPQKSAPLVLPGKG